MNIWIESQNTDLIQVQIIKNRKQKNRKMQVQSVLPQSICTQWVSSWSCDIELKSSQNNIYYKCLQGQSEIELPSGCKYTGTISNGLFHGKGKYQWPNGMQYEGEFVNGNLSGIGKFVWPDLSEYQGQIQKGKRHGFGTYTDVKNKYKYIGQWIDGKKQGEGKIIYQDGQTYEGNFLNDRKHGYGKMIYASKNQYEGQWKQDKKSGKGTMNWFNNRQKYIGEWKDNQPDGYGQYFWYQNKVEYKIFKNLYKGNWKNGKREGFGAFFYSNGCKFQGYFYENSKQGSGILIDQHGTVRIQIYSNNRPLQIVNKNLIKHKNDAFLQGIEQDCKQRILPTLSKKNIKNQSETGQHTLPPNSQLQPSHGLKPCPGNEYKKYLFPHPQINQNFYNMLLRYNSRLRALYKNSSTSNSQVKDFYAGMVLQNYWKMLRDSRILSQNLSLVAVNREIGRKRCLFDVSMPDQRIINVLKSNKYNINNISYENILWHDYFTKLQQACLQWDPFCLQPSHNCSQIPDPKSLFQQIDIHNPSNIILFRNFVWLLIHTAMLADQSPKPLKQKVQNFIVCLQHSNDLNTSAKLDKNQDSITQTGRSIFVPDWCKPLHEELIAAISRQQSKGTPSSETSVTVRTIYSLLEQEYQLPQSNGGTTTFTIFKDLSEKILYLQRIERYLNIKSSPLKKQYRNYYPQFQKNIKTNPSFGYLMNYQLHPKQLSQFLFLFLNRKITTTHPQQFQLRYKELLSRMVSHIQSHKAKEYRQLGTGKHSKSGKDIAKQQLIERAILEKRKRVQEQRLKEERGRQGRERLLMAKEDWDVRDDDVADSSQEYEYFS